MNIKQMKLDELSIEFIMASKSLSPFDTVIEVYKGHYGDFSLAQSLDALVEILSPIVQATKEIRLEKVLSELLPVNRWKSVVPGLPDNTPLNETIVRYLISEMRNLTKEKFCTASEMPNDTPLNDLIVNLILPDMKFLKRSHFLVPEKLEQ